MQLTDELKAIFEQILKYEQAHYRLMGIFAETGHVDHMMLGEISGKISGLRIAVCVINGWEMDGDVEGSADVAVREYAESLGSDE
jgi:hypothetical protein